MITDTLLHSKILSRAHKLLRITKVDALGRVDSAPSSKPQRPSHLKLVLFVLREEGSLFLETVFFKADFERTSLEL